MTATTKPSFLLLSKFGFRIVGPIETDKIAEAEKFFKSRGFKVTRTLAPPLLSIIDKWERAGVGRCTDGCYSVGLESCKHGAIAWLAVYKDIMRKISE